MPLADDFDKYFHLVYDPQVLPYAWLHSKPTASVGAEVLLRAIGGAALERVGASLLDVESFYQQEYRHAVSQGALYVSLGGASAVFLRPGILYADKAKSDSAARAALYKSRYVFKTEAPKVYGLGPEPLVADKPPRATLTTDDFPPLVRKRMGRCYICTLPLGGFPKPGVHCPQGQCIYPEVAGG